MLNLTYCPDLPMTGLETYDTLQGYLYVSNNVTVDKSDMTEILKRIKVIDDKTKDPEQVVSDYLEYGTLTVAAHFPPKIQPKENKNYDDFKIQYSLSVQYPGSVEWKHTDVPINDVEVSSIKEYLIKSIGCQDELEMTEKINDLIKQDFTRSVYDLQAYTMNVYNSVAEQSDGLSHIHCDFYTSNQAAVELLFKTDYLKDHTDYYYGKFRSVREYEESIDVNVRFQFGANLYEDGTGELIIRQYDIKARGKWEIENDRAAKSEDLPRFYKETIVLPLKESEITAVKSAVNRYYEKIPLSLSVDDVMKAVIKENERIRENMGEGPINEDIKFDRPYVVREENKSFIEVPLSFDNAEFDVLLSRQPLTYEDGTVISKTDNLRPDTWVLAFAQIDSENKAVIEMQIDGVSETQGKPEKLSLTNKESEVLIKAIDKACKKEHYSFDYLKSQLSHSHRERA